MAVASFSSNSHTASEQTNVRITALADGSFVSAWQSYGGPSGDGDWGVYVRHFTADGTPLALKDASGVSSTTDLLVNSSAGGNQTNPSIAALANGGFVVTWDNEAGLDGSATGVFAKTFSVVSGDLQMAAGADVRVNTHVNGSQYNSQIAAFAGGGYVVVWQADNTADGSGLGIFGQRDDANGSAFGGEFLINANTPGNQQNQSVASLTAGASSSYGMAMGRTTTATASRASFTTPRDNASDTIPDRRDRAGLSGDPGRIGRAGRWFPRHLAVEQHGWKRCRCRGAPLRRRRPADGPVRQRRCGQHLYGKRPVRSGDRHARPRLRGRVAVI